MSDEIVERLRKSADWLVSCACGNIPDDARDWIEAADEIERLKAQLKLMSMTAVGAEKEADDAHALIRELVAALGDVKAIGYRMAFATVEAALARAKAAGYEP